MDETDVEELTPLGIVGGHRDSPFKQYPLCNGGLEGTAMGTGREDCLDNEKCPWGCICTKRLFPEVLRVVEHVVLS